MSASREVLRKEACSLSRREYSSTGRTKMEESAKGTR